METTMKATVTKAYPRWSLHFERFLMVLFPFNAAFVRQDAVGQQQCRQLPWGAQRLRGVARKICLEDLDHGISDGDGWILSVLWNIDYHNFKCSYIVNIIYIIYYIYTSIIYIYIIIYIYNYMCVHRMYNRNKLEYKPLKDKSEMANGLLIWGKSLQAFQGMIWSLQIVQLLVGYPIPITPKIKSVWLEWLEFLQIFNLRGTIFAYFSSDFKILLPTLDPNSSLVYCGPNDWICENGSKSMVRTASARPSYQTGII